MESDSSPRAQLAGGAPAPAFVAAQGKLWRRSRAQTPRLLSFVTLVSVWVIASVALSDTVLPSPAKVFGALWGNLQDGETYFHVYKTIIRVVGGMAIAVAGGLALGIVMGLSKFGERFLDSWVLVAFTIPSVVYGIVALLWFGLNDLAAVVAIGVTAVPTVALNMWQGVKAIDLSLIHMGEAFRFSRRSILLKIVVPQTLPFLLGALRYALGVAWKIATVVELIGMSSGIGYMLSYWFGLFSMTQVLAWTLTFTIVLLFIEFVILKPLESFLTRWRPAVQR